MMPPKMTAKPSVSKPKSTKKKTVTAAKKNFFQRSWLKIKSLFSTGKYVE